MSGTRREKAKPRTTALERTAYHEAGHAAACFTFRRRVVRVSIIPDEQEETLGTCDYGKPPKSIEPEWDTSARIWRWLEQAAIISLAAGHAEAKFSGRHNHVGASADYRNAADLVSYLVSNTEELKCYLAWLNVRAKNLIHSIDTWRAVEALAHALLDKRQLAGREARRIYRAAYFEEYNRRVHGKTVTVKIVSADGTERRETLSLQPIS
jgi:hypothetical protein